MALTEDIKFTLNLQDTNGNLIKLTQYFADAIKTAPASPGILKIITPIKLRSSDILNKGKSVLIPRVVRDLQKDRVQQNDDGSTTKHGTFQVGANMMKLETKIIAHQQFMQDTKLVSRFDANATGWLSEAADATVNFLSSNLRLEITELYKLLLGDLKTYKLYTDETNPADSERDAQPTTAGTSIANILTDIKGGARFLGEAALSSADNTPDNKIKVMRAMVNYFRQIGNPKSTEKGYPFAYTGLPDSALVWVCSKEWANQLLGAKGYTQLISMPGGINGNVNKLDDIEFVYDEMLPDGVNCILMARNYFAFVQPNSMIKYIGVVENGGTAVFRDGTVKSLMPSQGQIKYGIPTYKVVRHPGLAMVWTSKALKAASRSRRSVKPKSGDAGKPQNDSPKSGDAGKPQNDSPKSGDAGKPQNDNPKQGDSTGEKDAK